MMWVTSFTVLRLLLFRQLEHKTEKVLERKLEADVRRFDVKDSASALST